MSKHIPEWLLVVAIVCALVVDSIGLVLWVGLVSLILSVALELIRTRGNNHHEL